ncbi:transposable element Tcb1 transposase [Trichonephila clavipes]|uniref:Transposable element Tcb1 transposase n=1 Tax=Trichonephila clavipes TaxID=2585209 RepID=A0A8X6VE14_TRICX|nr:transposable element Tcb1 transposase [Trichonephila clavipes]
MSLKTFISKERHESDQKLKEYQDAAKKLSPRVGKEYSDVDKRQVISKFADKSTEKAVYGSRSCPACMDWPTFSLDMDPVEHVWDMLGRRVAAHQPHPTCLSKLRKALLDAWCNIPQRSDRYIDTQCA